LGLNLIHSEWPFDKLLQSYRYLSSKFRDFARVILYFCQIIYEVYFRFICIYQLFNVTCIVFCHSIQNNRYDHSVVMQFRGLFVSRLYPVPCVRYHTRRQRARWWRHGVRRLVDCIVSVKRRVVAATVPRLMSNLSVSDLCIRPDFIIKSLLLLSFFIVLKKQVFTRHRHIKSPCACACAYLYTVFQKKHVTTFLMISWSKTVRLQRFLVNLLLKV